MDTYVDGSGNVRDAAYQYTVTPAGTAEFPLPATPFDAFVTDTNVFPLAPPLDFWLLDGPNSQWISPRPNESGDLGGEFEIQTTFDLTGFDPLSAVLNFAVTVDNRVTDVILNGVSTGLNTFATAPYSYFIYTPMTLAGSNPADHFVNGLNTLTFIVQNDPPGGPLNPTGFRLNVDSAYIIPEPATWGLSGMGLLLAALWRRRKWSEEKKL